MPHPPVPDRSLASARRWTFRSGGALTAWANSWLRGAVSFDATVSAIRDAGINVVHGLADHPEPAPIGWVLGALRSAGGPLRLVLPVPGDIRGVPAVADLPAAATRAGQLVVGSGLALLPNDDRVAASGWLSWQLPASASVRASPGEQQTISQATGALRLAVLAATDELAALDVARWNPDVETLRKREQPISLPPDHEPAAAALATRCSQVAAILELAGADAPGGALNVFGADGRDAALRRLAVAVREGLMTAYSGVPVDRRVDR